jgi:tetratricopeptide (TPR) repeat protein
MERETGQMKELTPPDSHHLLAAQGWLELGDHLEADKELDDISPDFRAHPDVLELRWAIYAKENRWDACVDLALAITLADPRRPSGWIHYSYALHVLKKTELAYTHLFKVAEKFPGNWNIPYNLACYCAQLGRIPDAEQWFKKAVAIDKKAVQKEGIDDPDLQPLWEARTTGLH